MQDTNKFSTAPLKNFPNDLQRGLRELSSSQGPVRWQRVLWVSGMRDLGGGYSDEICIKLRLIVTGFSELREILNFMCILMGRRQPLLKVKLKANPLTRVS